MAEAADSQAGQLFDIMAARRSQIRFRLAMTGTVIVFFSPILGTASTICWAALYAALQAFEYCVLTPERLAVIVRSTVGFHATLALLSLNGLVFGALSVLWSLAVGSWGLTCGGFLLAGSILNTVLTTTRSKPAFVASIAPFVFYLAVEPVAAWIIQTGPASVVGVAVSAVMLIVCALRVWETSAVAQLAERDARREQLATARELALAVQKAEAANQAKSTFLATMSHEIRTPLNGVLGMAQAMAAGSLSPLQRDRLDVVRQSGQALLAILNDVLDLSKIEAGMLELEEIEFDLGEIVLGAHAAFTALAHKKGLSFALDIDPAAAGTYRGDPTRLRQILYNLISNALKFTDAGEVRVAVDWVDNRLRLNVSDTGIGLSDNHRTTLFQKFVQADASTTRKFGGSGLGLAICSDLTALMGGVIAVQSRLGQGSTFSVRLPMARVEGLLEPAPPRPAEEECSFDLRVLAAEDNVINQLVLKTLLAQVGVDPLVVSNGAEAVEAWRSGDWDVILMDVQMPIMDGPTAARTIRETEKQTGRVRTPIIALTANAMAHHVQDYIAAGMDGHVSKPIETSQLFAAIDAALAKGDQEALGEARLQASARSLTS